MARQWVLPLSLPSSRSRVTARQVKVKDCVRKLTTIVYYLTYEAIYYAKNTHSGTHKHCVHSCGVPMAVQGTRDYHSLSLTQKFHHQTPWVERGTSMRRPPQITEVIGRYGVARFVHFGAEVSRMTYFSNVCACSRLVFCNKKFLTPPWDLA